MACSRWPGIQWKKANLKALQSPWNDRRRLRNQTAAASTKHDSAIKENTPGRSAAKLS